MHPLNIELSNQSNNRLTKFFKFFNIDMNGEVHPPIFTFIISSFLIGIHIFFFFFRFNNDDNVSISTNFDTDNLNFFKSNFPRDTIIDQGALLYPADTILSTNNYYHYLTYSFTHINFIHLINNVLTIIIFSSYIEVKYGFYRIGIIYILSSIASALAYCTMLKAFDPYKSIIVVGASGSVYGLFGTMIAELIINYERLINKPMRFAIIFIILMNFVLEFLMDTDYKIAHGIHFFGLLFGTIPALLYLPNYKFHTWEIFIVILAIIISLFYFVFCPIALFTDLII
jgi:membrane associated rhomboid family serine protease